MQPIVLMDENYSLNICQKTYSFKSGQGTTCRWPMQNGRGLGRCGMWNFLWRIGFHPECLSIEKLPTPNQNSLLFVDHLITMSDAISHGLKQWMQCGGKIIATGELEAWKTFFPPGCCAQTISFENPHAAIAYLIADESPQLIAPSGWNLIEFIESQQSDFLIGQVAAVGGERQTPERALLTPFRKAPAVIKHQSFYFFNGHPFAAYQAWLQGQEDLSPWLHWRHRLFWLDEWVSFLCDFMMKLGIVNQTMTRPGIKTLDETTVILRHDLDYSKDTSFLVEENKRQIGATHAVLKDRHTRYWVNQLTQFKHQEIAFHYNTGKRNIIDTLHRLLTKKNRASFSSHYRGIAGNGLLKQLEWAKRHGINISTIHRHLAFLIYPEWIDALDTVFESPLDVLGSSSLFRGHVLKWGANQIDGNSSLTQWPDAQFPIWYPFKLAHAGKNKMLNGWELTALMEIEPEMFAQLIDHRVKHISQNVFTLIFHPAHAQQASYYSRGTLNYFKRILEMIREREIAVMPMTNVFLRTNETLRVK